MSAVIDPNYRPLGLESDVANPNFAGARNPDDALWVQFYNRAVVNNFKSKQEGRPIFEDRIYIRITPPGAANLLEIDRQMCEDDKRRFPRQWAYFQQTHAPDGQNVGTPLSQWAFLRLSQVEELRALKFHTVEQVAFASDEQLGRIGMIAGEAPMAFRTRAKVYLESAEQHAHAQKQAEEIKRRDEEIAALKANQAEAQAKHDQEMAELRQLITQATRKTGGWPKGKPRKRSEEPPS